MSKRCPDALLAKTMIWINYGNIEHRVYRDKVLKYEMLEKEIMGSD